MLITTFGSAALAVLEKRMNNEQTELSSSNQLSLGQLDSCGTIRDHQDPSGSIRELENGHL